MPKSVGELLLFVSLAVPGLAYHLTRSQRRATSTKQDATISLARFVTAGFLFDVGAFAVVELSHAVAPSRVVDLRSLVLNGHKYLASHFQLVAYWGTVGIGVATVAAVAAGHQDFNRYPVLRFLQGPIIGESAWELSFNADDVRSLIKFCTVTLSDGTQVGGLLASSSPDPDETQDRELILRAPIGVVVDGAWRAREGQRLVLSARVIQAIEVLYLDGEPPADWLGATG